MKRRDLKAAQRWLDETTEKLPTIVIGGVEFKPGRDFKLTIPELRKPSLKLRLKRALVNTILKLWPIMPRRARLWAFMNDD